jgi:hypothetical protein
MAWLLVGSIPGVLIGSQLTLSVPDRPLRLLLAGVLGLSGLKLLSIPGTTVPIVVVLALGVAGLLAYLCRQSLARRQRNKRVAADQPT